MSAESEVTPETLKPCPFCGFDAAEETIHDKNEGVAYTPWYQAVCRRCDFWLPGARDEAEAIAQWNRRAVSSSPSVRTDDAPIGSELHTARRALAEAEGLIAEIHAMSVPMPPQSPSSVRVERSKAWWMASAAIEGESLVAAGAAAPIAQPKTSHEHRCLRCGGAFPCRSVGVCVANAVVLPRIVVPDSTEAGGLRFIDHCTHEMEHRGHRGRGVYDFEAKLYFGTVADLRDVVTFESPSFDDVEAAFRGSVDAYLDMPASSAAPSVPAETRNADVRAFEASVIEDHAVMCERIADDIDAQEHASAPFAPSSVGASLRDVAKMVRSLKPSSVPPQETATSEALIERVERAATSMAVHSFACGEWTADDEDETYEEVHGRQDQALADFNAALVALAASLRSGRERAERAERARDAAIDDPFESATVAQLRAELSSLRSSAAEQQARLKEWVGRALDAEMNLLDARRELAKAFPGSKWADLVAAHDSAAVSLPTGEPNA